MGEPEINPFRFTGPVRAAELIDRDAEAGRMLELAIEGNNCRLVAPRRYGKTSLLARVGGELPAGWVSVYVDLFAVLTLDDVAERIERAYEQQLRGALQSWFAAVRRTLKPTLQVGGAGASLSLDLALTPRGALLDRLALPRRLHDKHGTRVLVMFDEFQDVLTASDQADGIVRSEIQHHADAASYIFAGSHVGMMQAIFGDRSRPLFAQAAPVTLAPLPDGELGEYLVERFEASGRHVGEALPALLDLVQGHPQRAMLAAHCLWRATPAGVTASADEWAVARADTLAIALEELEPLWAALPKGQKEVLDAIARGASPYGSQRTGVTRGGAVAAAIRQLAAQGLIVERDPRGGRGRKRWRVVDPLLGAWAVERANRRAAWGHSASDAAEENLSRLDPPGA